jgi:predicted PurR-regulated permease PerM
LKPPNENQSRIIWLGATALAALIVVGVIVAFFWGLGKVFAILSPILWPLCVAVVAAYLLDPVVNWLEHRKIPRTRAIVLVFIFIVALLAAALNIIIPKAFSEITELTSKVPQYTTRVQKELDDWSARLPEEKARAASQEPPTNAAPATAAKKIATTNLDQTIASTNQPPGTNSLVQIAETIPLNKETVVSASNWVANILPNVGLWLFGQADKVGSLLEFIIALGLIPIYAFYFLLEKRGIKSHWKEYLPIRNSHAKNEVVFVLDAINDYLIAFFRGQVLVAICNGVLYAIGFSIIGLDYALLLGFFAVLLTILPFIGAVIVCLIGLASALMQYGDWFHPMLVLLVVMVVQSIESFLISPKIMGDRVGLHPMIIIVAVITGTTVFGGFIGGLLAIPMAATLRVILFRYVWKKRAPHRAPHDRDEHHGQLADK